MSNRYRGRRRAKEEYRESLIAGEPCQHRWQIAPPEGPTSRGECQHCGAEREFVNATHFDARDFNATRRDHDDFAARLQNALFSL